MSKLLLLVVFLSGSSAMASFPGQCFCTVTINGATPSGSGNYSGIYSDEAACNNHCSQQPMPSLGCGESATQWYKFQMNGSWASTGNSASGACSGNGNATTSPACPINSNGLVVNENLDSNCKVIAFGNGNQGMAPGSGPNDTRCPLVGTSDSCYRIISCSASKPKQDFCSKISFSGIGYALSTPSTANLVCPPGLVYRQDGSGTKDICMQLSVAVETNIKPVVKDPVKTVGGVRSNGPKNPTELSPAVVPTLVPVNTAMPVAVPVKNVHELKPVEVKPAESAVVEKKIVGESR